MHGATYPAEKRALSWMGFDPDFSRALGAKGWLGLSIPKEYGGHNASLFERFVVNEELLAAGAPVTAHWIADRQSAPLLLRHGTPAQKQRYLPAICAGEMYFCIGMSEPASGSDLASVRTKAELIDGEWVVHGRKIWTSDANVADWILLLCRTGGPGHEGLSMLVVPTTAEGIGISTIRTAWGSEEFAEVTFDAVRVPADAVVGEPGQGWAIAMSLLADPAAVRWRWLQAPLSGWLAVAYLGWVATIAAYAMWTSLLKRHPANRVAPFSLGVPVVGLTAGVLVLGERIDPWQWAGIAFVVAALACVMFGGRLARRG